MIMKNVFTRILAFIIAALITLSFCACTSNDSGFGDQSDPPKENIGDAGNDNSDVSDGNEEIKNVILIIGDGMGLQHISAGQMYWETDFAFTDWQFVNVNTDCLSSSGKAKELTDSAAAGTAIATGELTARKYVGVNMDGGSLTTILDIAKKNGKSTGIVTTDYLTGGTPAAFSAHNVNRDNTVALALSQITSGVDLLCGSYSTECSSLVSKILNAGYRYVDDPDGMRSLSAGEMAYCQLDLAGASASVQLADVAIAGIEHLSKDEDGFVIMIEQAYIDIYSHWNDFDGMVRSVKSLNDTVERVMQWVGDRKDTAVIVTADHETGGLRVSADKVIGQSFASVSGKSIYYGFLDVEHTNAYVGMFVYGISPDYLKYSYYSSRHLIKNTDIFKIMNELVENKRLGT